MAMFSVEPDQLLAAATTVERQAAVIAQASVVGYGVAPAHIGLQPLAAAVEQLQDSCDSAMDALVGDLKATAANLRSSVVRYVTTDTDIAADIVSGQETGRP